MRYIYAAGVGIVAGLVAEAIMSATFMARYRRLYHLK